MSGGAAAVSTSGAPRPDPVSVRETSVRLLVALSSLPRLHVRGDGASLSQTLEAFVRVVEKHPVLRLEVWLRGVGCWQTQTQLLPGFH